MEQIVRNKESPEQAPGYWRFLIEIFAYVGEQIPHTPSFNRPKGRGIKPQVNKKQFTFIA